MLKTDESSTDVQHLPWFCYNHTSKKELHLITSVRTNKKHEIAKAKWRPADYSFPLQTTALHACLSSCDGVVTLCVNELCWLKGGLSGRGGDYLASH